MPKQAAHFLHIGKTGGTAIKSALERHGRSGHFRVKLHSHSTRFDDIRLGEKVFFVLRQPVTRFVSGFNSRQRQGRPRYNVRWSLPETLAFNSFSTANDLAEALDSEHSIRREEAESAMRAIGHVRTHFSDWLGSMLYLASRLDDILFVGFQESLEHSFIALREILGLGISAQLPNNPVTAHRNPDACDTQLSKRGVKNIRLHYEEDIVIYNYMARFASEKGWISETIANANSVGGEAT